LADAGDAISSEALPVQTDRLAWRNWSGLQVCHPKLSISPKSMDELVDVVKKAAGPIRPVGGGWSFPPLIPTDDTIVELRSFTGLMSHDAEKIQATFGAGTRLSEIGAPLAAIGQALPNMPDVQGQTLAGAFGTATHGTGNTLPAMHDQVVSMKLLTAAGDLIECSADKNPEIFAAAKVSLGALGIITEYTLQDVPLYNLHRRTWVEPLEEILERVDDICENHLTFEFFYIPFSGHAIATTTVVTDEPVTTGRPTPDDGDAVFQLKYLRDKLGWFGGLRAYLIEQAVKDVGTEEFIDECWKIFPHERSVRFNETEYHLPREVGPQVVREARDLIEKSHKEVFFPIEFRHVKEDDAWLSPFYQRPSACVATHRYFKEEFSAFFEDVQDIHDKYEGRPHWGKLHRKEAADLAPLYPRWQDFLDVRAELDPEGKFLNEHLHKVFGV
jgi:FAD-linked oxidoreductase